jgi:hypothetical protein
MVSIGNWAEIRFAYATRMKSNQDAKKAAGSLARNRERQRGE